MRKEVITLTVPYDKFACKKDDIPAKLTIFHYDENEFTPMEKRPAVIVCPGGAYFFLCEREGWPVADEFAANGVRPFVLEYSVTPNKFPAALMEIAEAIRIVRERADEFGIDRDKILVMGSSAGGHLGASIGTLWNEPFLAEALGVESDMIKPNGVMANYPVITAGEYTHQDSIVNLMGDDSLVDEEARRASAEASPYFKYASLEKNVDSDTAKTFLWTSFEDDLVPIENSLAYVKAMKDAGVPVEFHLFPYAGHGMSLANERASEDPDKGDVDPYIARWFGWAIEWIKKEI